MLFQHSHCHPSQRVADWRRMGSHPAAMSLTEKEQHRGHLRVSMRPGRLVRQDHAARNSAGVGPLHEVRGPGPQGVLGAHVQVRVTKRVDGCEGSRRQEPLRTGCRQLAAFIRRLQSNDRADPQAARPAPAVTPEPSPLRSFGSISGRGAQGRQPPAPGNAVQRSAQRAATQPRKERVSVNQHAMCRPFAMCHATNE
jgi:hypothetical protein